MSMKVKNQLPAIFFVLIVLPLLSAILFGCFVSDKYFFYGYSCSGESFYLINFVTFIGGLLLIYVNYKKKYHSKIWYIVGGIIVTILALNLFALSSLSHFGF